MLFFKRNTTDVIFAELIIIGRFKTAVFACKANLGNFGILGNQIFGNGIVNNVFLLNRLVGKAASEKDIFAVYNNLRTDNLFGRFKRKRKTEYNVIFEKLLIVFFVRLLRVPI